MLTARAGNGGALLAFNSRAWLKHRVKLRTRMTQHRVVPETAVAS